MNKQEQTKSEENKKGIDANKVIDYLTLQNANLTKEIAILKVKNDDFQLFAEQNEKLKDVIKKQEKVIEVYKNKEKSNAI